MMASSNINDYECQYFYEDEVYRFKERTGKTQFGIVLENSEYASSDQDSDSEDAEEHKLKKGQIRVTWYPSGKENIISEKKVHLADRSLMPGDVVVRKENGREKICGYIRKINVVASVNIVGSDQVLCNVKSENLQPIEAFSPDIAVTLDNWVGMARSVKFELILRTKDGSMCRMDDHQALDLRNLHNKYSKDSEFHHDEFYPGQVLVGKLSQFESVTWLEGGPERILHEVPNKLKKKTQVVARVEQVNFMSIGVQWQCQSWAGNDCSRQNEQPKFSVEGEDLKRVKMLNVFEPCTLQLGDKSFYHYNPSDLIMGMKEWDQLQINTLFPDKPTESSKKMKTSKNTKHKEADDWESEGSEGDYGDQLKTPASSNNQLAHHYKQHLSDPESRSSSRSSHQGRSKPASSNFTVPTRSLKRRKLRKAKSKVKEPDAASVISPGDKLVVETLCTYSWVDVVWQDGTIECGIPSKDLYPVHHLDDKEFFPGDFVILSDSNGNTALLDYGVVQRVDAQARTALVRWMETCSTSDWMRPKVLDTSEVSVYDLKDHPDFKFRPGSIVVRVADPTEPIATGTTGSAGQVLDNHVTGQVEVWWAEGNITLCWPQELYRVGDYDSEAGELWDDGSEYVEDDYSAGNLDAEVNSQASWETESETSIEGENDEDDDCDDEESEKREVIKTPKSISRPRPSQVHRLLINFEKARSALQKLGTLLDSHGHVCANVGSFGTLQTGEVLKILLESYKQCRYLDRLMGSSFFHERNFEGLLEKVREDERQEAFNRLSSHIRRLFGFSDIAGALNSTDAQHSSPRQSQQVTNSSKNDALNRVLNVVEEMCHKEQAGASGSGLQSTSKQPSDVPLATANESQQKLLQVCIRLSQLLRTQLACSTKEMNRMCGTETKGTSEDVYPESPSQSGMQSPNMSASRIEDGILDAENCNTSSNDYFESTHHVSTETRGTFEVLESAHVGHKFYSSTNRPVDAKLFQKCLRDELGLLRSSLPQGIHVKTFEDRMDLFSVMIEGPSKTPYEGGLFFFDIQLPDQYPRSPPLCHYWSYCTDRLNPNLYEEGKVCVSLLGTWSGKGSEMWGPGSNLLQVLISIMGLILVPEPYYNEAGYERQRGSPQARENSRLYNEMVLLKMLQAMGGLVQNPPSLWRDEVVEFIKCEAFPLIARYQHWMMLSEGDTKSVPSSDLASEVAIEAPCFPLVPASKGFCLTLAKSLQNFEQIVDRILKNHPSPGHQNATIQDRDNVPNQSLSSEEANLSR